MQKTTTPFDGPPAPERTTTPPGTCRRCSNPTTLFDGWPDLGPVCVACPLPIAVPHLPPARRSRCRADVLALLERRGSATRRAQIVAALTALPFDHGESTVVKELAQMVKDGAVVNLRDQWGYRLPAGKAVRS